MRKKKDRRTLTPREVECLSWIAQGKTYEETSMLVEISRCSVKTYLDTARHKLDAVNLPHAVALAMTYGIIFMKEEAIIARKKIAQRYYGEFGVAEIGNICDNVSECS